MPRSLGKIAEVEVGTDWVTIPFAVYSDVIVFGRRTSGAGTLSLEAGWSPNSVDDNDWVSLTLDTAIANGRWAKIAKPDGVYRVFRAKMSAGTAEIRIVGVAG
jgi:hypothetical protein